MQILALVSEAFGGQGGIALYNRDLLSALCNYPGCTSLIAIPRLVRRPPVGLPAKLHFVTTGVGSKPAYLRTLLQAARTRQPFDLIVCGHINLLPLAFLVRLWLKVPLLLEIYGIDAWGPTRNLLTNALAGRVDAFVSISELTSRRFRAWLGRAAPQGFLLPNAVHTERYGPGAKNPALLERYGLCGKTVLMTLGRMWASEKYLKGFDRVLESLPELARRIPNVTYLAAGDGDDRPRLTEKATSLRVADRVVFPGHIAEAEKADHYRLADAFVMPSEGEGFGFVFLEAMACGIPVVASRTDGGREALRNGELGILVDPRNPSELQTAIHTALRRPRVVPPGLEYFSFEKFSHRLHAIVDEVVRDSSANGQRSTEPW